jgi:hypothetical protein
LKNKIVQAGKKGDLKTLVVLISKVDKALQRKLSFFVKPSAPVLRPIFNTK